MRVTVQRWGLLLGLGVLGLATLVLPPAQVEESRRWHPPAQDALDRAVAEATDAVRRHALRWVAARAAEAERAGPVLPVRVTVLGGRVAALETLAGEAARQLWAMVPEGPAPLGLHLVVLRHEGEMLPGVPLGALSWNYSVLPDETDGRSCRLVVPINWQWLGDKPPGSIRRELLREVRTSLGPCALWKAFGPPGPAIRDWLVRVDYRPAVEGTWATRGRVGRFDWWRGWPESGQLPPFGYELLRRVAGEPNFRYGFGPEGAQCLAGRARACGDALTRVRPRRAGIPHTVLTWGWAGDPLGPEAPSFLSDLVVREGRERFATFWRSDAPPLEAFAAAFDTSAEAWTSRWMRERYGALDAGSRVDPLTALGALLASLAVVGAAVVELNRRAVS